MSERNTSPTDLLRRYRRNIFPPRLDPFQRAVTVQYLEERGFEPKVGVVSGESKLPIENLVKLAMKEVSPSAQAGKEDFIVGPNSVGLTDGISLYGPAAHRGPDTEPRE